MEGKRQGGIAFVGRRGGVRVVGGEGRGRGEALEDGAFVLLFDWGTHADFQIVCSSSVH